MGSGEDGAGDLSRLVRATGRVGPAEPMAPPIGLQ